MGNPVHAAGSKTYRFGAFEINVSSWHLRRNGRDVHVQELPLRLLLILVEYSGELVTREGLGSRLWPTQTFVEFDDGLNTAVQKIRLTLRDDARNPHFVETAPRQGYRTDRFWFYDKFERRVQIGSISKSLQCFPR